MTTAERERLDPHYVTILRQLVLMVGPDRVIRAVREIAAPGSDARLREQLRQHKDRSEGISARSRQEPL